MTRLHHKISEAVNRARTAWAFMMVGAFIVTLTFFPAWCLLLLFPFGIVSYIAILALAAFMLSGSVSAEELQAAEEEQAIQEVRDKLAAGSHTPDETMELMRQAGMTDVVVVDEEGPIVGTYKDRPIYEFLMIKSPDSEVSEKFVYHGPANVINGMPEIPVIDGMTFAHVEGVLYTKVEPE